MAQPQPAQIAQHLHNAADEIALFNNLPAIREARILQELVDGVTQHRAETNAGFTRIEARLLAMETRIAAVDHNSQARIHNASVNNSRNPLEPLRTPQNNESPGFPVDSAQLSTLSAAQLNILFAAYGLRQGGTLEAKRKGFRRFIGIVSDV